ncbi:protein rogdi homolog isoform X2 [Montipora capricornis]|uniref:protein rogdi homolog isoform X2 n=1 Tax=Montipora capricornis TaxID=246305 RepID=UPI0035F10783
MFKMAAAEEEEDIRVLRLEFEWLLREHVPKVLTQLGSILQECSKCLKLSSTNLKGSTGETQGDIKTQDYFMLSTPNSDTLKGYVAVEGENISKADLKFKIPKASSSGFRVFIQEQSPWKLKQIQDAINYLQLAIEKIKETKRNCSCSSGQEVSKVVEEITSFLTRGKSRLSLPDKTTVLDMLTSGNQRVFKPGMPEDIVAYFCVNSEKLLLSVYTLTTLPVPPQGSKQLQDNDPIGQTFEYNSKWMEIASHFEVDCSIPRLNDAMLLFGAALRLCQQLKDKFSVFSVLTTR